MQFVDFLSTAEWIIEVIPDEFKTSFLRFGPRGDESDANIRATHEFVRIQNKLIEHEYAPRVLAAFGLDELLNPDIYSKLLGGKADRTGPERGLASFWFSLTSCVSPLKSLTLPEVIQKLADYDDVLTIEFRLQTAEKSIDAVNSVLEATNSLYVAINKLSKVESPPELSLVFSSMGSGLRFDFTGVAETVAAIKSLLVEAWHVVRHRKAEDLQANKKAALDALSIIREIEKCRLDGSLPPEDATEISAAIVGNVKLLFAHGISIREIEPNESINNDKLLEEFQQKLLPAPADSDQAESKSPARKSGVKRKKSLKP